MLVMTREPETRANPLLQDFLALEIHEGYWAELINGEIVVTPPPDGDHENIVGLITKQVVRRSRAEMSISGRRGLVLGTEETGGDCRVIPDLTVAPAERRVFRGAPSWMHPAGVALVVEVTSQRAELDRNDKRLSYTGARVPLYLLVDREREQVMLFSGPLEGDYGRFVTVVFGGKIELPEPFGFALDTAEFTGERSAEEGLS